MNTERNQSSDEEYTPNIDGIPEQFERDLKCLGDIARNPLHNPLVTIAAFLIITTFVYLAFITSITHHPILGLIVIGVATITYVISKFLWQIQYRYMVQQLVKSGELDQHRD